MTAKEEMSPADWQTLQFAAIWAGRIVMRELDAKMLWSLTESVYDYATSGDGRLAQEVCMSFLEDSDKIVGQYLGDSREPIAGLMAVKSILDRQSPDDALKFKLAIDGFARKMVDSADHGSFLRRRKARSQHEERLATLRAVLGVRGIDEGG